MNELVKCNETIKPWLGAGQFGWTVTHLSFSASALAVMKAGTNPPAPHPNCTFCTAGASSAKKWLFLEAVRHPAWVSRIKTAQMSSIGLSRPQATFSHKSTTQSQLNSNSSTRSKQNKTPVPHSNYFCVYLQQTGLWHQNGWKHVKSIQSFGSSSKHFSISNAKSSSSNYPAWGRRRPVEAWSSLVPE